MSLPIIPVKVGGCEPAFNSENIIAGLRWIKENPPTDGSTGIINLSFGFLNDGYYETSSLETAVQDLLDAGFFVTAAAGNDSSVEKVYSSCDFTPARLAGLFTVGAYTLSDDKMYRSDFSNSGSCVDLWAPGDNIESGDVSFAGTSVAAPYVAGLAAILVGEDVKIQAGEIGIRLKEAGSKDKLLNKSGHLLDANTSFSSDSSFVYTTQTVADATVNLIARMPVVVPAQPSEIKGQGVARLGSNILVFWDGAAYSESSGKYYSVEYLLIGDDGIIDGDPIVKKTQDTSLVLGGLADGRYAVRVAAVNNGVKGLTTFWFTVDYVDVCMPAVGVCP